MNGMKLVAGIVLVVLAVVGYSSVFTIFQTEQALVLRLGKPKRAISNPGLNFKIPFIENVVFFDRRNLDYDVRAQEIPTLDQKQIIVDAFTRYRIVDPLMFFQTVTNERGMETRLDSIVNSTLRAVFGNVDLAAVLTDKRAGLMETIFNRVKVEGVPFGIDIIDVRLKRVDLPPENSQAVFRRMQTQREQEARKIRAEGDKLAQKIQSGADKQATIIRAEAQKKAEILMGAGEEEAQRIYNKAYSEDSDFFNFWVSLNAMREGLKPATTRYVGPATGDFFRYFKSMEGQSGGK